MQTLTFPKSFPNSKEIRFLKLALSTDADFPHLWKEWKDSIIFNDIDYATMRLLPFIYLRLEKLGVNDELAPRIKGIYRLAWVKNQRLLAAVKEIAKICDDEKIPLILLKGIPLLLFAYQNTGARFLGDADILIPPSYATRIMPILKQKGWKHTKPWVADNNNPTPSIFHVIKSSELKNSSDLELDIHWGIFHTNRLLKTRDMFLLRDSSAIKFRDRYIDHSIPATIYDIPCRRLSNEDMLIHIIVHGAGGNVHRTLRWVIDVALIIENMGINWNLLLERTNEFGFGVEIAVGFEFLTKNFNFKIPDEFIAKLKLLVLTEVQIKKYYENGDIPHSDRLQILGNLPFIWYAYFLYESKPRLKIGQLIGFAKYLRTSWGIKKNSDIFKFAYTHYRRKWLARSPGAIANTKKVVVDSSYIVSGRIISFLASFVAVTCLGLFVPREVVGSYNYIIAVLSIVSLSTLPGMNHALVRSVGGGMDGSVTPMMGQRLKYGVVGSFIALGVGLAYFAMGNILIGQAFLITAPFVPLTDTFSNFAQSFWQGKKRFDLSSLMSAIYYLGLALISIPFFIFSDNLLVIITGVMLAQTLMGILTYLSIKKENEEKDIPSIKLGKHLSVMQIFNVVSINVDRVLVWYLFGPITVAIYSFAASPVAKAYQIIPFGIIALPHWSGKIFTKENKRLILKKTFLLFILTIPATILIILSAPLLFKLFFPKYPESIFYFQVLVGSLVFSPLLLIKAGMTAFNQTKELYISGAGGPIIKILLMVVMSLHFGMNGLVFAIFISSLFDFLITLFVFLKIEPLNQDL
jgi:O-antigen/teichoic acid export membrane protein